MGDLLRSLRYAGRTLAATPLFTVTAVVVLALGIGVNAAIFSVVDSVMLRSLPYPDADRLVILCETNPAVAGHCVASPPNVEDWSDRSRTLESIGLGRSWNFSMRVDGGPARGVSAGLATPGLFRTFGVTPAHGRLLLQEDNLPSGGNVVVLTHALWSGEFGSDASVVGRTIALDGEPVTIIGVLPDGFVVPTLEYVQLWRPLHFDPREEERRAWRGFMTVGRLASHGSLAAASAELSTIHADLAREHPAAVAGWGVRVVPLKEHVVGSTRAVLLAFSGAVVLLLIIACANIAALLLVRATDRQREFAIRVALGANARRISRQVFAESFVLSVIGGVAAVLLGAAAVRGFVALAPSGLPRIEEVRMSGSALAFTMALTLLTSLLIALAPAVRAMRSDPYRVLREHAVNLTGRASLRTRRLLVGAEIALSLMLLVGAGLLTRSFAALLHWNPGFDPDNLVTISIFPPSEKYSGAADVVAFYRRVEEEIAGMPGTAGVAGASAGPLFGGVETGRMRVEGRVGGPEDAHVARWFDISPGYFRTLGLPVLRGRDLDESDGAGATPSALVNETMARRFWPGEEAVGQRVTLLDPQELTFEVVGVVPDVPAFEPGTPPEPEIYWSNRQLPRWATFVVVRAASDPARVGQAVHARLQAMEPDLSLSRPRTLRENIDSRLVAPRFYMLLMAAFATVALVLASAGIFGTVAYSVMLRQREFGIRLALGARKRQLISAVLSEGLLLTGGGIVVGLFAAATSTRAVRSMLSGVSASDPMTFVFAALVLALVAAAAALLPALRASRLEPMVTLRSD